MLLRPFHLARPRCVARLPSAWALTTVDIAIWKKPVRRSPRWQSGAAAGEIWARRGWSWASATMTPPANSCSSVFSCTAFSCRWARRQRVAGAAEQNQGAAGGGQSAGRHAETLLKQPGQEGVLWFNAGAADDALRQSRCRPICCTLPGRAMQTDALAQYLVARRWKNGFW